MAHIKNPFGRISEIEEEQVQKWVNEGFTIPTPEEVTAFETAAFEKRSRIQAQAQLYEQKQGTDGVYMITVTQGGKDGYGIASGAIINELRKQGVDITTQNNGQRTALLFHNPYSIMKLESPIKILYTMFESDKLPNDWNDYLEIADKILVPSKWCSEVFKKCGFDTTVVPLGFDSDVYKLVDRKPKRPERQDFVFLHYNAFNIRKGFVEVFKAFVQEFKPSEPVKMIFKTNLDKAPLPLPPSQYPNIEVITGTYSDEEMNGLLTRADCFVYPSRGEGFGITPLEAMATGLPTIVPNAHGITEYFNETFMYEVKVAEKCPALYSRYKGQDVGSMVVCDVDDLARQMRYIYEHEEEGIAKGKAASFYAQNWTFKNTATKLKQIIDESGQTQVVERPLKNVLPLREVD